MNTNNFKIIGHLEEGKPTVLFIPGNMCCPTVFNNVEVPSTVQSAIIDWAMSEGPWAIDVLGKRIGKYIQVSNLGPTILSGYSAGGVIALYAALEAKEAIAGLLLSNTGANTKDHGDPNFPQKILDYWGTPKLHKPFLDRAFARHIPNILAKETDEYYARLNKGAVYEAAYSLRQLDITSQLKDITCPVTIAHGVLDTSRTIAHAQELKNNLQNCKLVWLDGGHTIMIEDSKGWQAELDELISKVFNK